MKWDEFLKIRPARLNRTERKTVERRLDLLYSHTGVTQQFVLNFRFECRIEETGWLAITRAIITAGDDPGDLCRALAGACRGFTRQGDDLALPWPSRFGRAVTRDNFCDWLEKSGRVRGRLSAKRFVNGLLTKDVPTTRRRMRRQPLGRYMMWATWNASDPDGHPFGALPDDADGIRSRLGLSEDEKGKPLLLFDYSLPAGVKPQIPTLADAYAGDPPWSAYFRPSPAGSQSGRTHPWKGEELTCPEAVHEAITGETLQEPIREVW